MTMLTDPTVNGAHDGPVTDPDPEVPAKATRRRFTAAYKRKILAEYDAATEPGAKGALLRREGLYTSSITQWRQALAAHGSDGLGRKRGRKPADPRDAQLARANRRAEKAEAELAKARLIIEVQGKVSARVSRTSEVFTM
ncbi:MAG: transposase [Euzebya sp.]